MIDLAYFNKKYDELDPSVKSKGKEIANRVIDEVSKGHIELQFKKHGRHMWIHENFMHFGWGMWFRNQLRNNGLNDSLTPDGNWDDYYVSLIEDALGLVSVSSFDFVSDSAIHMEMKTKPKRFFTQFLENLGGRNG